MGKSTEKIEKMKLSQIISNFIYAFKIMMKIYPSKFACTSIYMIFKTILDFFTYSYILRYVVNGLQEGKTFISLLSYVIIMFVLNLIFNGFEEIYKCILSPIINKKCSARFEKTIFKKSVEMDMSNFEDPKSYDLYCRAVNMGGGAINNVINVIDWFIGMLLRISLNAWLILIIDPVLFIFALLPLAFNVLNMKVIKIWYEYNKKEQQINRKKDYTRRVFYLAEYAKEMRLTNIGSVMLRRFKDAVKECIVLIRKEGLKKAVMAGGATFGVDIVSVFGAEFYAVFRTLVSKSMLYGDCLVILNSIGNLSWDIMSFGQLFSNISDIAINIQDYRRFISLKPRVSLNLTGKDPVSGDIILRNVSFRYLGADKDSLRNINMTIRKGEKIAIVGENGAGKTTLVKLLMRLYDVTDGEITVGGTDIRELKLKPYRMLYGTVFQDYRQFSCSVAENVLGRKYTDEYESVVVHALKSTGIWDKIAEQPNGIHSMMTKEFDENGIVLSGGESQKLAIAAIYAGNCDIVILDEPTSALDPIAEHEMYENMKQACNSKTMIFISHRLSSAVDADRIFVMEHGSLIESGSHNELMSKNGKYAEMFNMQAQNYV